MKTAIALLLAAGALASPVSADVVHLTHGGRVAGEVADLGDVLPVKLRFGEVRLAKGRVLRVERKARRALERELHTLVRHVQFGSRRKCDPAHARLGAIAREQEIAGLERFAHAALAHHEAFWTQVRQSARVQAGLTRTSLKRPIRTLSTGAVTLQLAELSVAAVRAVVVIPAGRGMP